MPFLHFPQLLELSSAKMVVTCLFLNKSLGEKPKWQHATDYRDEGTVRDYLISMPAAEGVLKLDTMRWRRRLKACSISFDSDAGSIRQNDPLPGSSCDLGTFTKKRLSERLCRIEFYSHITLSSQLKLTYYSVFVHTQPLDQVSFLSNL